MIPISRTSKVVDAVLKDMSLPVKMGPKYYTPAGNPRDPSHRFALIKDFVSLAKELNASRVVRAKVADDKDAIEARGRQYLYYITLFADEHGDVNVLDSNKKFIATKKFVNKAQILQILKNFEA